MCQFQTQGFSNIVTITHYEVDLINQALVAEFFAAEQPKFRCYCG